MRRVPFISIEFNAMALGRSSRLSRSWTKMDWRVGVSKALHTPLKSASPASSAMVIRCNPESVARTADCSAIRLSTVISILRRFTRSPSTPANGARKRCGALCMKPMRPVNHVDPDSR